MGIRFLEAVRANARNNIVSSSDEKGQALVDVPEMPFEWLELQLCQMYHCTPSQLDKEDFDRLMAHMYLQNLYDKTHNNLPKGVSPYIASSVELIKLKGG